MKLVVGEADDAFMEMILIYLEFNGIKKLDEIFL